MQRSSGAWVSYVAADAFLEYVGEHVAEAVAHPTAAHPSIIGDWCWLVSEPGNGKSSLISQVCRLYPRRPVEDEDRDSAPVVSVVAPPVPEIYRFARALGAAIGPPMPTQSLRRIVDCATIALRNLNTQILIVDEAVTFHGLAPADIRKALCLLNELRCNACVSLVLATEPHVAALLRSLVDVRDDELTFTLPLWRGDTQFQKWLGAYLRVAMPGWEWLGETVYDGLLANTQGTAIGQVVELLEEAHLTAQAVTVDSLSGRRALVERLVQEHRVRAGANELPTDQQTVGGASAESTELRGRFARALHAITAFDSEMQLELRLAELAEPNSTQNESVEENPGTPVAWPAVSHVRWRHYPTPRRGEALGSYLVRVSAANNIRPAELSCILGEESARNMGHWDLRIRPEAARDLSAAVGHPTAAIVRMTWEARLRDWYPPDADGPHMHPWPGWLRTFDSGSICPMCVREARYVHMLWRLDFLSVCPVHGIPLESRCRTCSAPILGYYDGASELLQCFACNNAYDEENTTDAARGPAQSSCDVALPSERTCDSFVAALIMEAATMGSVTIRNVGAVGTGTYFDILEHLAGLWRLAARHILEDGASRDFEIARRLLALGGSRPTRNDARAMLATSSNTPAHFGGTTLAACSNIARGGRAMISWVAERAMAQLTIPRVPRGLPDWYRAAVAGMPASYVHTSRRQSFGPQAT